MTIRQIQDLDLQGKRVLIRVDFNVPMKGSTITNDSRIRAALPTIKEVMARGGKVILVSHLGRPKGVSPEFSLRPCAEALQKLLGVPVTFIDDCVGPKVEAAVQQLKNGEVALLENVRFYPAEENPEKDPSFAERLSRLGDVYINDAFGTAHRAHSSTAVVAKYFPHRSAAGFLMMKEIQALGEALCQPKRPFVAVIGGLKISTKLKVLESLLEKADTLLIGGAMSYTFLKAANIPVGTSVVEDSMLQTADALVKKAASTHKRLLFPVDLVVASDFRADAPSKIIDVSTGIPNGFQGMDIGPKTLQLWAPLLQEAKTIFWNGPVGVFEFPPFARGTKQLAEIIAHCRSAFTVVGGGDSVAALEESGVADAISHVSTGGGASLEFLEQGTLPGIQALESD
jgi:phosphoglycerate kinase